MVTRKNAHKKISTKRITKKFVIIPSVWTDPRNVLYFLSERGIPKVINKPKEVIAEAREWLKDDWYIWGSELWNLSKKWPIISEKILEEAVRKALTAKYMNRPSPRFPAGILCGISLKGNDGNIYKSMKEGKHCVWRR